MTAKKKLAEKGIEHRFDTLLKAMLSG